MTDVGLTIEPNVEVGPITISAVEEVGPITIQTGPSGVAGHIGDISLDGIETVTDVDVSGSFSDARRSMFSLLDNANDFETLYVSIKRISATTVRITSNPPLIAGSYRLLGVQI